MKAILLFALITLFVTCPATLARPGDLDSTFGVNGVVRININPNYYKACASLIQPDGKIIVAGNYERPLLNKGFQIFRLNSGGSIDKTFNDSGNAITIFSDWNDYTFRDYDPVSIAQDEEGKFIVAGNAYINTPKRSVNIALVRYLSNGKVDSTFGINGLQVTKIGEYYDEILGISIQKDGKVIALGASDTTIGKLNFKFILIRYLADGRIDSSYGTNGIVENININVDRTRGTLILQQDEKLLLGGYTLINEKTFYSILRYDQNGRIDSTFGENGMVKSTIENSRVYSIAVLNEGQFIVNIGRMLVKYNLDGSIISTFGENGCATFTQQGKSGGLNYIAIQSDGKILGTGLSDSLILLVRFNENGTLDKAFGIDGMLISLPGTGRQCFIQNDNKICVVATSRDPNPEQFILTKYIADNEVGVLDSDINEDNINIYPNPITDISEINFILSHESKISIYLIDLTGKLVKSVEKNKLLTTGQHIEKLYFDEFQSKGRYLLLFENGFKKISIKIIYE